jgi:hypothetical protein
MHLKLHNKNSLTKSLGSIKLPEAGTTKGVTSQGTEPCMKKIPQVLIECSKEVDVKPGMCRHKETVLMDSRSHPQGFTPPGSSLDQWLASKNDRMGRNKSASRVTL